MLQHFSTWYTNYQCEYCGTSVHSAQGAGARVPKWVSARVINVLCWCKGYKCVSARVQGCKGHKRCWCKGHNIIEEDQQSNPGPVWTGLDQFKQVLAKVRTKDWTNCNRARTRTRPGLDHGPRPVQSSVFSGP
jgi:hypothetical protein